MAREVTRRQLMGQVGVAAAGVTGLSMVGCSSRSAAARNEPAPDVVTGGTVIPEVIEVRGFKHYVTRPDLSPPVISIRKTAESSTRHIFMNAPVSAPGRGGSVILDSNGNLVWMGRDEPYAHRLDFNMQTYQGKPVLTWWEGFETHGWGQGQVVIADSTYHRIRTLHAHGKGIKIDHHEFNITAQDTALVSIYKTMKYDLRPIGGPKHGVMATGVCQEIDIKTGELVSEWNAIEDGVHLTETHQPFRWLGKKYGIASNPFDFFHINSLAIAPDGNLLISSRNCWTIFKVHRQTKKIIWRLGGKKSDFTFGPGVKFYWQHHVRPHGDTLLSVFDNGAAPNEETQSRALLLDVDEKKMHVTLRHHYVHPGQNVLSAAMGSAQLLPNGNMLVGWGTNPYFSEFTANGRLVLAGQMTKGNPSYRVFSADWTGHPDGPPDVVARHRPGGATVYTSWNGATEAATWSILAGKSRSALKPVGSGRRKGFETAIAVNHSGPFFAVRAHDAKGQLLATSATVEIS